MAKLLFIEIRVGEGDRGLHRGIRGIRGIALPFQVCGSCLAWFDSDCWDTTRPLESQMRELQLDVPKPLNRLSKIDNQDRGNPNIIHIPVWL